MYPTQHRHLSTRTHITQRLRTSIPPRARIQVLYNILIRSLPDTPLTSPTSNFPHNLLANPNMQVCNMHMVMETDHPTTGKNPWRSSNTW